MSRCKKANVVACTDIGITRRWIFRLNLPLTAMSTVAVFYFMPLKPVEGSWLVKIKMVDFFGCALTLAASTLIVVSLWLSTWVRGMTTLLTALALSHLGRLRLPLEFSGGHSPSHPRSSHARCFRGLAMEGT